MNSNLKKLVVCGVLSALAIVVAIVWRIPIIPGFEFLKYDCKDVIIAVGGFVYGPFCALLMAGAVTFVEMITVSTSGIIGFAMNFMSSAAFVCAAAFVYKRHKTILGAVMGLISGMFLMTAVMLLWNYVLTPLYMSGVTREFIAQKLIPVFLPFNLIKSALNAAVVMLIYKPAVTVLRKLGFMGTSNELRSSGKWNIIAPLLSLVVLIAIVALLLWINSPESLPEISDGWIPCLIGL